MAQDWKAEVVRAAYGATGYAFNNAEAVKNRGYIEAVIDAAVENDIYVVIDWHSHNAHNAAETERAKDFFSYFAKKYGHLDNVIFELYNEPKCADGEDKGGNCLPPGMATWAQIKEYAEQVIPVIREHSDNLILIGTPEWDQKIETAIASPIEDSNIGYVLHFYAKSHSLGNYRQAIISVQGAGLPLFVTEFGTTTADGGCSPVISNCARDNYSSHDAVKTDEWLNFLNSRKISYCAWSLFDKYEGSAFFGTKPNASFEQTNPENWVNTSNMTASGAYIFNMLRKNYETAEWTPILNGGKTISNSLQAIDGKVYISLEKGGNVRLDIYSLKGELVKTLFNGNLNAGSHQFSFDLPKGVFILQLSQKNGQNRLFIIKK
jgi:endoglucanase